MLLTLATAVIGIVGVLLEQVVFLKDVVFVGEAVSTLEQKVAFLVAGGSGCGNCRKARLSSARTGVDSSSTVDLLVRDA